MIKRRNPDGTKKLRSVGKLRTMNLELWALVLLSNPGWSNFFTFAGYFLNLFELAGLSQLEIVENHRVLYKKKRSSLGIDLRFSYFRPKIMMFSAHKKALAWNRSQR